MYATIHTTSGPTVAAAAGTVALAAPDRSGTTTVALWPDEAAAAGTGARVHRVTDVFRGRAAGRRPLFAQVVWVNGDGDRTRADAAERDGRERIWPAVQHLEGIVEVLALRSADDRIVVVALAIDRETHEQVRRAITSTPLLPDEDPTLLTGPDRVDVVRVLSADLPTAVRS
ncbi:MULTISPECIES: hypothetical protein [unclassified Blastococcus]